MGRIDYGSIVFTISTIGGYVENLIIKSRSLSAYVSPQDTMKLMMLDNYVKNMYISFLKYCKMPTNECLHVKIANKFQTKEVKEVLSICMTNLERYANEEILLQVVANMDIDTKFKMLLMMPRLKGCNNLKQG